MSSPSEAPKGAVERPRPRLKALLLDPRAQRAANTAALVVLFYFLLQRLWPAPLGVIVQGALIGSLSALIAFGIALIYRANRIINFAQGDLGAAPAVFAVLLIVGPGVPYVLALPLGVLMGALLGGLVEFLVIRRFFRAPRLVLTVVTIGLAQLLAALGLVLPSLFDFSLPPQSFQAPFDLSFEISPIVFGGNDVIAMVTVPVAIVGLAAFFRYTNVGIAIRASAESADRASLLGIPVKRLQTIVWVLASALSTVAILMRAGVVGLPIGTVLGPAILLRSLAAAVIGRMERLPTIFFAAVGIGIVEQAIVYRGRTLFVAPFLFVVIVVALLVQRRQTTARGDEQSSWQAARDVRPIPRELARLPEVRYGIRGLKALGLVLLVVVPLFLAPSRVNLLGAVIIYAMIGVSLVILTGWAGQISLGQMAMVGLGAAMAGSVTSRLHWDLLVGLLLAGVGGTVIAVIVGLPALRIKGLYLAVTTIAFALMTSQYLLNPEFFSWWLPEGRVPRPVILGRIVVESEVRYYYLILASFVAMLYAVRRVRQSRTGRIMIAVRENERSAQAMGVNAVRAKLMAFGMSGFFAAVAGGLFVHHQQGLGITVFEPAESLAVFVMVVIGGLGSIPGAIIGAIYVRGITWFLPADFRFFTNGAGVVLVLLMLPGGLGATLYQLRDTILRRIAARRDILVPSLVADARSTEATRQRRSTEPELPVLDHPGELTPAAVVE
ncbi:MAG TPA: ABC transporter permease [Acidimicrobiales bacterium]|nr:ABC transporter permease [Acidimicrobiales bacterium]